MTTKLTLLACLCFCAQLTAEPPEDSKAFTSAGTVLSYADPSTGTTSVMIKHLIITKQEAADVIKAMEIFSSSGPFVPEPYESAVMYATNPPTYENSADSPAGLRRRAEWLEAVDKAKAERDKDLVWARGVLETWRNKMEGCK